MSDFRLGVKAAVPTALGYVAIGLAFGVVAAASGLSALEVGLMCALVYGGSAQFAMCALVVAGASLGELTLTVFLVNLRNMLMSLHATTIFTKTSLWNQLGIGSLITESYWENMCIIKIFPLTGCMVTIFSVIWFGLYHQ